MVIRVNKKIEVIKMEETLKLPEKLQKQIGNIASITEKNTKPMEKIHGD